MRESTYLKTVILMVVFALLMAGAYFDRHFVRHYYILLACFFSCIGVLVWFLDFLDRRQDRDK